MSHSGRNHNKIGPRYWATHNFSRGDNEDEHEVDRRLWYQEDRMIAGNYQGIFSPGTDDIIKVSQGAKKFVPNTVEEVFKHLIERMNTEEWKLEREADKKSKRPS